MKMQLSVDLDNKESMRQFLMVAHAIQDLYKGKKKDRPEDLKRNEK